jgi:putative SOS response-associated peptidase YedK
LAGSIRVARPVRSLGTPTSLTTAVHHRRLPEIPNLPARYNIAPTQPVPAVRVSQDDADRELALLRRELIPSWATDPAIGNRMINARADTVATKPAFRKAFRQRRCLIATDGFYEWKKLNGKKQPYYIHLQDGRPFAFAGPWEHWGRGSEPIDSCNILTTDANDVVGSIHDRMPVIVDPRDYDLWLDPDVQDAKRLEPLLVPYTGEEMAAYPVNKPRADDPKCIEPAAGAGGK